MCGTIESAQICHVWMQKNGSNPECSDFFNKSKTNKVFLGMLMNFFQMY